MSKIIVGLDIGTTKIACFVGRKNEHGKIEILSMGKSESLGVTRGMVSNIEKTIKWIREAPEAFDAGLARRGLEPQSAKILALDAEHREVLTGLQAMQARRNEASKATNPPSMRASLPTLTK